MMLFFYLLSFVVVLSVIVIAHEGGHFFAARRCGVQVEAFSVGFGKKLWSRKDKKGTEWRICAIPLGGYVQMLGDEDAASTKKSKKQYTDEEKGKTFFAQPVWKRAIIIFAGPFMNYVLAFFIFFGIYLTIGNFSTVVSDVKAGSSADLVGLQKGDVILSVDDLDVMNFLHAEHVLRIGSEQGNKDEPIPPVVDEVVEGSLADKAGLQNGDVILSVNDIEITDFDQLKDVMHKQSKKKKELVISVQRGDEVLSLTSKALSARGVNSKLGIISLPTGNSSVNIKVQRGSEVVLLNGKLPAIVGDVLPKSLADKAGIQKGDKIVSINGETISNFDDVKKKILLLTFGKKLDIKIDRNGQTVDVSVGPLTEKQMKSTVHLGINSDGSVNLVRQRYHLGPAFVEAGKKVCEINYLLVLSLKKLVTGGGHASDLSGPVGIATASGDAAKDGPLTFISFVALLSICVGFFNLLPVPVLDGGHLALLAYEAIARKPLSEKTQNLLIRIGMSLLMALVVFTLFNDVPRVISRMFGL